jgi:ABC-type transporter Mla MlaB component
MTNSTVEPSRGAAPFEWRPTYPLTIEHAAEAWRTLTAPIAERRGLDVDLSQTAKVDTAGCQVLVMAQRACAAHDAAWRLHGADASALDVMRLLGVNERLVGTATTDGAGRTPDEGHP